MLHANSRALRGPYPDHLRALMSIAETRRTRAWLSSWQQLTPGPTPLQANPDLARRLRVAQVYVKDESVRSPLGSFKALGAPGALVRLVMRLYPHRDIEPTDVLAGVHASWLRELTVISATDGNHGRALAAAAQSAGCACVIVLHARVSIEREQVIAAYGARILRVEGNYDASVDHARRLAAENGWQVVSDTSYEGYEDVPRDVMQGYGIIAAEVVEQLDAKRTRREADVDPEDGEGSADLTHVFLQGGVGGLAAGVASYLWELFGERRPRFVVVEPRQADCLYQSAVQGRAAQATGSVDSVMAGLACGETSPLAWRFLDPIVDAFLTVDDDAAIAAMRDLATGSARDRPIVAGESGAAGLAGLQALRGNEDWSQAVGLDESSRVLLVNTEGATAPSVYRDLTGESAASVLRRQSRWQRDRPR